jgi:hypothetical protein
MAMVQMLHQDYSTSLSLLEKKMVERAQKVQVLVFHPGYLANLNLPEQKMLAMALVVKPPVSLQVYQASLDLPSMQKGWTGRALMFLPDC